jgi:hypothetical protein
MQVLITLLFPLAICRPGAGVAANLFGNPMDHRIWQYGVAGQRVARVTQQAHPHREADCRDDTFAHLPTPNIGKGL